jgi:surfeit locus 1 family protein
LSILPVRRGQGTGPRWASRLLVGVALVACVVALTALGGWQIERRSWKLALIDRVESRVHAEPGPLPSAQAWPAINATDDAYRRVRVTGHFLHERETVVKAVTVIGSGFWVVTPLRTEAGFTVLVNRGFVPTERRDPATRREGNPEGAVTVTGLLRMSEPGGAFLRTNDPAADRWYSRDVGAIAAARGLQYTPPFFIDADATANPGGYPVGGLTVVRFRNNHLIYALTWFAMASMLSGALVIAARDRWRFRGSGIRDGSVLKSPAEHRLSRTAGSDAKSIVESA